MRLPPPEARSPPKLCERHLRGSKLVPDLGEVLDSAPSSRVPPLVALRNRLDFLLAQRQGSQRIPGEIGGGLRKTAERFRRRSSGGELEQKAGGSPSARAGRASNGGGASGGEDNGFLVSCRDLPLRLVITD